MLVACGMALALWALSFLLVWDYCILVCWIPAWWIGFVVSVLLEEILLTLIFIVALALYYNL